MIFIIDGADGSGKTTLAKRLSDITGYKYFHFSYPKTIEEKLNMVQNYREFIKNNPNAILDRSWYSEMVYGPVMRGPSYVSHRDMQDLELLLAKYGGLIIYCTDKPEVLWKRATERGEDYVTDYTKFVAICEKFDEVLGVQHLVPVVKYDYKDL